MFLMRVNPPPLYAARQNLDVVAAVDLMGPIQRDAAVVCPAVTSARHLPRASLGAVETAKLVMVDWQPMRHLPIARS